MHSLIQFIWNQSFLHCQQYTKLRPENLWVALHTQKKNDGLRLKTQTELQEVAAQEKTLLQHVLKRQRWMVPPIISTVLLFVYNNYTTVSSFHRGCISVCESICVREVLVRLQLMHSVCWILIFTFSHFPTYMPPQHTLLFIQPANLAFFILFLNYPPFLLHMPHLYSLKTTGSLWDV